MRTAWMWMAVGISALTACGDDGASQNENFDLEISAPGYAAYEGKAVRVTLTELFLDDIVRTEVVLVSNGTLAFVWPDVLVPGDDYAVSWYVDVNGNAVCNQEDDDFDGIAPSDSGGEALLDVSADVALTVTGGPDGGGFCERHGDFDLRFRSNFGANPPRNLYFAVVASDGTVVDRTSRGIGGNETTVSYEKLLVTGESYKLRFFLDQCNAPPTDSWELSLGATTDNVTVDFTPDENFVDVCGTFPP